MSKIIAITRAVGAGVTALYHAIEAADHAAKGQSMQAYDASLVFETARADFMIAVEDLTPKPEPRPEAGPYRGNGAGSVMPIFHGSDDS